MSSLYLFLLLSLPCPDTCKCGYERAATDPPGKFPGDPFLPRIFSPAQAEAFPLVQQRLIALYSHQCPVSFLEWVLLQNIEVRVHLILEKMDQYPNPRSIPPSPDEYLW